MKRTEFLIPITFGDTSAKASISEDSKMQFIFTDSLPNGNNQGIRLTEFASLIKTGKHKPVKIGEDGGHFNAFPIGVITDMEEAEEKILGAATLWNSEFPDLISELKQAAIDGLPLQTSWEILYEDSEVDDNGIEWLQGCNTKAIAIVDTPAYAGRTPVLAIAQKHLQDKELMTDKEIQELIGKASKLEAEVGTLTSDKLKLNQELDSAKATLEELVALKEEVESLRTFKAQTEEASRVALLKTARLAKLEQAGIDMPEEEFTASAEKWMALDDAAFDFLVETLAARQKATKTETAGKKIPVPNLGSNEDAESPQEILKATLFSKPEEK